MTEKPLTEVAARERQRPRRTRGVRAKTISVKRMAKSELELGRALHPPLEDVPRPARRSDCEGAERPARSSRASTTSTSTSFRGPAPSSRIFRTSSRGISPRRACSTSERGGAALETIGGLLNLTHERVRQLEVRALAKLVALGPLSVEGDADGK